jgi:hypothetical protein
VSRSSGPVSARTLLLLAFVPWLLHGEAAPALLIPPYLQLGSSFSNGALAVVWHTSRASTGWNAQWRSAGATGWSTSSTICEPAVDRDVCTATLPVGRSGTEFDYRVRRNDEVVATGRGHAAAGPGRPVRFAVLGDFGDGTSNQKDLARRLALEHQSARVDFGLIAGDIAYECGRRDEYERRFFPVLNPDDDTAVMRTLPFAAAVGNHDVGDLRWPLPPFRCSSDYSFFTFWRHPSGPAFEMPVGPKHHPKSPSGGLPSGIGTVAELLAGANYAFAWGDAHVTVLDSNRYVNWAHPSAERWLEETLSAGATSRWRFVLIHHPPFNVSDDHEGDQWSRYLVPAFERHHVTAVFSGHVHNFQWFGPARFTPDQASIDRYQAGSRGRLRGAIEVQSDYDGVSAIRARWPVYVITGAGGGSLILESRNRSCPPDVTTTTGCGRRAPADGRGPSLTIVEVTGDAVTIRQVSANGATVLERRIG